MATSPSPATDVKDESKDFIEHLRTVHFALAAVCVALCVILLSAKNFEEALIESRQVYETANAIRQQKWLKDAGKEFSKSKSCLKPLWNFAAVNAEREFRVLNFNSSDYPRTLGDFKEFWDEDFEFVCPSAVASKPFATLSSRDFRTVSPDYEDRFAREFSLGVVGIPFPTNGTGYFYVTRDSGGKGLIFKVERLNEVTVSTKDIMRDFLPDLHLPLADFSEGFRDLDQTTAEFKGEAPISLLRPIIEIQERASSGTVEIVGQKFPVESATRWGVLIIVGIQLYFLLHYAEFRNRHFGKVNGAWIGAYTSPAARSLFCATAFAAPVGVIAFVCWKAGLLPPEMVVRNFALCTAAVLISAFLAYLTARTYFRKDPVSAVQPAAKAAVS